MFDFEMLLQQHFASEQIVKEKKTKVSFKDEKFTAEAVQGGKEENQFQATNSDLIGMK